MLTPSFTLHEITAFLDPYLFPWFDLYEQAFPPHERVSTTFLLQIVRDRQLGDENSARMVAAVDGNGEMVGLAQTQWFPEERTLFLGYLAVHPSVQGQGIGSALFQELTGLYAACEPEMILWDVESVEHQQTPHGSFC